MPNWYWLTSSFFLLVFWTAGIIVYRLVFHPLARYPGPFFAKVTDWYAVYHAYVGDLHLHMWTCHERYGKFVRYGPNKLLINSHGAKYDIYSRDSNVHKSTAYQAFRPSSNAPDLQSTVDKVSHARKRRVMSQAFSESALKSLEPHVLQHIHVFLRHLLCLESTSRLASQNLDVNEWAPPRDMAQWSTYLSFDLMSELVFGRPFGMLVSPDTRFIIDLIEQTTLRAGVYLHMPRLAAWNMDKIFSPKMRELRDRYLAISMQKAEERLKMEARQDLFSHMFAARDMETGDRFTVDEIWVEAQLLIIAGADAISTAIAACFFYLVRDEHAYQRVCDEVRGTFATLDEIRSGPKLSSCTYLTGCVEEAIRMSPPVGGALWREVCAGDLSTEGQVIPAGVDVGVPIYALQHDATYFSSPFKFLPERWIPSDTNTNEMISSARKALNAFSTGPTGCIGKNLAYMEVILTMAHVLWSLDMALADEPASIAAGPTYLWKYKDHARYEYRLRDRFTSWKSGPAVKFRRRIYP